MVLETTQVQNFGNRGVLNQYDTLEYSILEASDIKIHKDKSVTLFKKGELSRELSKANSNHSSIEANLASLDLVTDSSKESNSDGETNSDSSYEKIKTEDGNFRKWTVKEAKRDAYCQNHYEKTTANQTGALGDAVSIANGVLGLANNAWTGFNNAKTTK